MKLMKKKNVPAIHQFFFHKLCYNHVQLNYCGIVNHGYDRAKPRGLDIECDDRILIKISVYFEG